MLAFPTVGAVVLASGWRVAWAAVGVCLVAVIAPVAWMFARSTPDSVGAGDGRRRRRCVDRRDEADDATLSRVRCGRRAFWVFALASSLYGLVASGIGLFNESVLAERGFAPGVYHTALAVTAITGLAGNFVAGAWAERGSLRARAGRGDGRARRARWPHCRTCRRRGT